MYLKSVYIKNFQFHKELKLDFNSGINVIYGDTGTGKSSFFKALEFLFNCSDVSEEDYRREGTKKTVVKGVFDSGWSVERIRSNSINRYVLSKDGKEKVFDNFGKDTPEEIQKVLEIEPIEIEKEKLHLNFASQDQLNFILDNYYSDIFKAKLFNKLTGNEILDELFKKCNSDGLRLNRDIKSLENQIDKQEDELVEASINYKSLKKKYKSIKTKFEDLLNEIEIYNNLKKLSETLNNNTLKSKELSNKLKTIKIVSEDKISNLKEQLKKLNKLKDIFVDIKSIDSSIQKLINKKKELPKINVDLKALQLNAKRLVDLKEIDALLEDNTEQKQTLILDLKVIQSIINKKQKELKKIWKNCEVCPLCKQKIKN